MIDGNSRQCPVTNRCHVWCCCDTTCNAPPTAWCKPYRYTKSGFSMDHVLITAPSGSSCSFNNSLYKVGRSLLPSLSRKVTEGSSLKMLHPGSASPLNNWNQCWDWQNQNPRSAHCTAHSGIFGRQPVFPAHWSNPSFSHLLILGKTVQCCTWGNAFTLESHIACHGNTCINHNEQQQ